MPVSDTNTATAAISTATTELPNNSQHRHTMPQQHIPDEDLSLHGSSVMDETEENERGLQQVMDGYDFLSSADSDIEIPDQQPTLDIPTPLPPPIISPSSSSSTESSYLPSQSTVSNASSVSNEAISVDADLELDERVSEPESIETVPNPPIESHASSPTNPSTTIPATPEPVSTTTANFSPPVASNQASTTPTISLGPPQSDFVFKTPAIPKIPTHNATTQPSKIIKLSSQLPNTTDASSSSSDVQGRTFVSKGGDVRVEGYSDSDLDLQDIIERLNTNKNKKRRFKPRAPTSRNIKQRLTWIAHSITQSILNKVNPRIQC